MYKDKKVLGIIPARGGSKRLPNKNIIPLNGKPLLAWSIQAAKQSKYLDKCIVSTDSLEIAKIAEEGGGKIPFIRPPELSSDTASLIDVIFHAVEYFGTKGETFDYIVLLEPTSPLRENGDIDDGIKKLVDSQDFADSLVSVGEIALEHPSIAKKISKNGYVEPFYNKNKKLFTRKQDMPKTYFPYGVIYISKISTLKKYQTFYQKKTLPLFIKRWQNYEIDEIYDLTCIEAIMKWKKEVYR